MKENYNELTLTPSGYYDILLSYLMDIFPHAIEEVDGSMILRSEESLEAIVKQMQTYCRELSERVGEEVTCAATVQELPNQDWIEEYKRSVLPVGCGPFYIRPSWHEAREGMIDILIDPALAFGSGHHPSTCGVLEMIAAYTVKDGVMLDVGCGSGILAIAASKLGMKVSICDTDPLALDASCENFVKNNARIADSWVGSASMTTNTYDLVAANIVADILMLIASELKARVAPGGVLILSGIVEKYKEGVLNRYKEFEMLSQSCVEEWVTLALRRPMAQ